MIKLNISLSLTNTHTHIHDHAESLKLTHYLSLLLSHMFIYTHTYLHDITKRIYGYVGPLSALKLTVVAVVLYHALNELLLY